MPYFHEKSHYQAIAHLLVAGDIAARVVSNGKFMGVEVKLEDGSAVVWGNSGNEWAYSVVDKAEGDLSTGRSNLGDASSAEAVAELIATWEYSSAPVATT